FVAFTLVGVPRPEGTPAFLYLHHLRCPLPSFEARPASSPLADVSRPRRTSPVRIHSSNHEPSIRILPPRLAARSRPRRISLGRQPLDMPTASRAVWRS